MNNRPEKNTPYKLCEAEVHSCAKKAKYAVGSMIVCGRHIHWAKEQMRQGAPSARSRRTPRNPGESASSRTRTPRST